jgi:hypothetical protein
VTRAQELDTTGIRIHAQILDPIARQLSQVRALAAAHVQHGARQRAQDLAQTRVVAPEDVLPHGHVTAGALALPFAGLAFAGQLELEQVTSKIVRRDLPRDVRVQLAAVAPNRRDLAVVEVRGAGREQPHAIRQAQEQPAISAAVREQLPDAFRRAAQRTRLPPRAGDVPNGDEVERVRPPPAEPCVCRDAQGGLRIAETSPQGRPALFDTGAERVVRELIGDGLLVLAGEGAHTHDVFTFTPL